MLREALVAGSLGLLSIWTGVSATGLSGPLTAAEVSIPEAASPKDARPGQVSLLKSPKGMRYFLRVPSSCYTKRGARLIIFLHGSNINGLSYLRSFEAKKWAPHDILVCPNGEKGDAPQGANNFTFRSAVFVADVTQEVQAAFTVTRTYIGGHSQGGFVTFSAIMHYPELFQGAFPMACDCWMQNEPNLWEDKPDILAKQARIAIAVIHGKKDTVVDFSQGEHAYEIFLAMGYPKVRLLAPERLGHQFVLSPVDEALAWLDAVNGFEPSASLRLASDWARQGEWGWVFETARAITKSKRGRSGDQSRAKRDLKLAEAAAAKELGAMRNRFESEAAENWLAAWYEFRRRFGRTETARPLVERYNALRREQRETGRTLFREARTLLRKGGKSEGHAKLRELLDKAPATYEAYYAAKWLKE